MDGIGPHGGAELFFERTHDRVGFDRVDRATDAVARGLRIELRRRLRRFGGQLDLHLQRLAEDAAQGRFQRRAAAVVI